MSYSESDFLNGIRIGTVIGAGIATVVCLTAVGPPDIDVPERIQQAIDGEFEFDQKAYEDIGGVLSEMANDTFDGRVVAEPTQELGVYQFKAVAPQPPAAPSPPAPGGMG